MIRFLVLWDTWLPIMSVLPCPFLFARSNEPKSVPARDLGDCRDSMENTLRGFFILFAGCCSCRVVNFLKILIGQFCIIVFLIVIFDFLIHINVRKFFRLDLGCKPF